MAKIKIHAGDFKDVHAGKIMLQNFIFESGFWSSFKQEVIPFTEIEELEVATDESVRRVGGTIGWGLAGGVIFGPAGFLAGLVLGGRGRDVTFVAKFKDGRKLLATTDGKTYTKMQASIF